MTEKIVVVDLGAQYNNLLARRIRQLGVYSELWDRSVPAERYDVPEIRGIILSGSPCSVYEEDAYTVDPDLFRLGKPVLGICYGMQLMCHLLGGKVEATGRDEYGPTELNVGSGNLIAGSREDGSIVWMSHRDQVVELPDGFITSASTAGCRNAAVWDPERKFYGLQFHPEVTNTVRGMRMLSSFVMEVCGCAGDWRMDSFVESKVSEIRETVGDDRVLCALSGGVDSAVTAALLHKAIGKKLVCVFVDHGLLRKGEADAVRSTFGKQFGMDLVSADASELFLRGLSGITDPETKRKTIGKLFIDVFEEESRKLEGVKWLAQGTIYPDVVESGTGAAHTIKSHHNVGGLPEKLGFRLIEPLRELYKDEVREVGRILGLPDEIVERQPFPGPGLAVRCVGEVTADRLRMVRESDAILREEIKKAGLERDIWQYFTVDTGMRSVGVMGDSRTYCTCIAVRAVTSVDAMSADWARIPWEVLSAVSSRIVNEVPGVNRVVYDITSKPPGTIEWE